ncbi:MAG TPA: hypothetical protein VJT68_01535 [Thermoleophilaceae bacterium]|nr:hypothetical protein [Thermoleophilaceae bacterium]
MKSGLLGTGLALLVIALPSAGSAQGPAPCSPDRTAGVDITTQDPVQDGRDIPLYATHEVAFSAEPLADATQVKITPEPGVTVLDPGKNGQGVDLVMPPPPSLTITVTWTQSDGASTCSASRTMTFEVLKATPSRVKRLLANAPRRFQYDVDFQVRAALRKQNMAPIELTLRRSSRARLPSPGSKALHWSVPMREGERRRAEVRQPGRILGTARGCQPGWFSCGAVFSEVRQLNVDYTILRGLSFTHPARIDARFGIDVDTRAGADHPRPRPFGFDIQARQDGRLIARYQRAGICREANTSRGIVTDCRLSVVKNFPR